MFVCSSIVYNETCSASKRRLFEYPFGRDNDSPVLKEHFKNIQSFIDDLSSMKSETEQSVLRR
jgi:hypothetical protein